MRSYCRQKAMLDYHAHIAALRLLKQGLTALVTSDGPPHPALVRVNEAITNQPSSALLGAVLDHLFEHTGASDVELSLLEQASGLWQSAGKLMSAVAGIRSDLESLVLDPSQPGALDQFNALADRLHADLQPQFDTWVLNLQAYYAAVRTLRHVTQHGQAFDQPVSSWSWRDILLSRRTGAFMANLARAADDDGTQEAIAFAFGALSGYAANIIGSAYQNHVVEGPRRSHPYRDRLARGSIGAWLRQHFPILTVSLNQLRASLSFGAPSAPSLPPAVDQVLTAALTDTYGAAGLGPLPDLDRGYANLLRHLELLTSFTPLPLPQPINDTLWSRILPLNLDSGPGGGPPPMPGPPPQPAPPDDQGIPWWQWVNFAVCPGLVALRDLLGIGSPPKQEPYPGPFHDPDPTANQTALTHYLTANEALISVNVMFNLHTRLYAIAQNSLKVLKLLGMVYPEAEDLTEPEFAQFTIIADKPFAFPKRQIADRDLYLGFPTSRTERPQTRVSPWVPGNTPIDFLVSAGGAPGDTVATYGLTLWVAQALGDPASELLQVNRNLDADRGYKHECWKIRDRSSITDDPVGVEILGYNQI